MGSGRRLLVASLVGPVLLAPAVVVGAAGPAAAHDSLPGSDPAAGSTVHAVPARITLRFAEPAQKLGTQIAVLGPDGDVAIGGPVLADATVSVAVGPGAPAGAYRVSWRVTSADGHPVEGILRFTVGGAAATSAPAGTRSPASPPRSAGPTASAAPIAPTASGAVPTGTVAGAVDPARSRTVPVLAVLGVLVLGAVGLTVAGRRRMSR